MSRPRGAVDTRRVRFDPHAVVELGVQTWSTDTVAVERYWRDARLTKIFEGTSEIQQRIISDHLLGKPKAATA